MEFLLLSCRHYSSRNVLSGEEWGETAYFRRLQKFWFEISLISLAQWNGTFQLHRPNPATAHLVIVLASRIQKSSTGNNNFVKWKGTFRSDRPKWPDRSKWTTFKAGHEYSGWTKLKWSIPFDVHVQLCTNRNFWNFGFNGKHPLFTCV